MAANSNTREEAVDAFVARAQSTLDCVINGATLGSGNAEGIEHGLVFYAIDQTNPSIARLATHGGTGEIVFRLEQFYTVLSASESAGLRSFTATTTFNQYRILDFAENEIVVYDWAPFGRSPIRTPDVHVPAAGSITLKQQAGSPLATQKTFLGSFHLPTGYIVLADIVKMLIREFQVVPRREDWQDILAANREAMGNAGGR